MSLGTIRRATLGILLVWIGTMMIVDEPAGVASLGAGVILLGSALARRLAGRRGGFFLWGAGALLVLFGLSDLNGDETGIPLVAVALITFGALILSRAFTVSRRGVEIVRMEWPPRSRGER